MTAALIPLRREVCPRDPVERAEHDHLLEVCEAWWRLSAAEKRIETDHGRRCGWCGGVR